MNKPTEPKVDPVHEEIKNAYQKGSQSIQTLARVYKLDVSEVLDIIGEGNLSKVRTIGDQIAAEEAGPGATISHGEEVRLHITTN